MGAPRRAARGPGPHSRVVPRTSAGAGAVSAAPELCVVVPSHDRPLRLRWLLNALEEQTLERGRREVVVAHDSRDSQTPQLLGGPPLAREGTLRELRFPAGSAGPAEKRNAAWRAARAPLILFTDDDCRPPENWLRGGAPG